MWKKSRVQLASTNDYLYSQISVRPHVQILTRVHRVAMSHGHGYHSTADSHLLSHSSFSVSLSSYACHTKAWFITMWIISEISEYSVNV